MSYRQVLDDAIGQAPPSTIEVSGIIGRQRRRMAMRRAVGAAGTAAVVVALVVASLTLARSGIRESSPIAPGVASDPAALVGSHLDQTLWTDLSTAAPGLLWVTESQPTLRLKSRPDSRDWFSEWNVQDAHRIYVGQGTVSVHGRIGTVLFNIDYYPGGPSCPAPGSDATKDGTCTITAGPGGAAIQTDVYHYAHTDPAQIEVIVTAYRPDGLRVMAENRNQSGALENVGATGMAPPLTAAQLTRIAEDPAFALAADWN
jgi:hypothetical protein